MKPGILVALIQSRAFGAILSGVFVVLIAVYGYERFRAARKLDSELNLSCFGYRDVNRNGIYDLGDRPYAGFEVSMRTPGGKEVTVAANVSGFANFTMSRRSRGAHVRGAGPGVISVKPPPGWIVTSGNERQTTTFQLLEGSPVGIVAGAAFQPVGLAPLLTISGRVARDAAEREADQGRLRVTSPRGVTSDVAISPAGRFSISAEPGEWQFEYAGREGGVTRKVRVEGHPIELATLDSARATASGGRLGRVANFDTLTTSDTLMEIPNGYAGLRWHNWVAMHQKSPNSAGMINATTSAEFAAYNSSGHPATVSSDQPFDLVGGYVGVVWPEAEKSDIIVRAWRADRLVHEDRFRASIAGAVFFSADYHDVTRVEFASETFWQIAVDDLQFRVTDSRRN